MTRRLFLASGAALTTFSARAEEQTGPFRVAALWVGSGPPWLPEFMEEMGKLGYATDHNLSFEALSADGQATRLPELAAELLARRPDVILVGGAAPAMAFANLHVNVPVVFIALGVDPIRLGLVQSLPHPGGYFTGLFNNAGDHNEKNLQLLRDLLPNARRVAFLVDPSFGPTVIRRATEKLSAVAEQLRFEPKFIEAKSGEELPSAFDQMDEFRAEALVVNGGVVWGKARLTIIELARSHRIPAIYLWRVDVADGGLMSYGADMEAQYRQAAMYVDKILHGASPADLPVEQATRFKLVINVRTARELGIQIPWILLTNADELIE